MPYFYVDNQRRALETCDIIKKLIIEPNNADVFMHMWYDDDDLYMEKGEIDMRCCDIKKGIDKELVEFYKPKGVLLKNKNSNNLIIIIVNIINFQKNILIII